jgi:hypothetical protein
MKRLPNVVLLGEKEISDRPQARGIEYVLNVRKKYFIHQKEI